MVNMTSLVRAAALCVGLFAQTLSAQTYPSQPIRMVVPYPPGGFTDLVSREVASRLSTELGQSVVVENRPGAGTNLAADLVSKATPDGYTLLMGTSSLAINQSLYSKLTYHPLKNLSPLGIFAATGYVLLAKVDGPLKTLNDVIKQAKSGTGKVSYGSSGNGAVNHLAGELFATNAGVNLLHVPYKGSQAALVDLSGGRIDLFFSSVLEALPQIQSGRVIGLGTTTAGRLSQLPNIEPIGKTLQGYEVLFWMGLFAPGGISESISSKLAGALQVIAKSSSFDQWLAQRGAQPSWLNPTDSKALIAREITTWGQAVKASGARVD